MHVEVTDCRSSQQSSAKTRTPGCGSPAGHLTCSDCSARVAPVRPQLRKRRYFWNGTDKRHCTATERARRRGFVLIIHADIVMESKKCCVQLPVRDHDREADKGNGWSGDYHYAENECAHRAESG